jgi:allantoinase
MPDCIVRGGLLVQPSGVVPADLAIDAGRISAIGPELPGAPREIDARGLTVFPGVIDDHVHFNEPGRAEWEGAATGSAALAAGGGVAFFDMPLNSALHRGSRGSKPSALRSNAPPSRISPWAARCRNLSEWTWPNAA